MLNKVQNHHMQGTMMFPETPLVSVVIWSPMKSEEKDMVTIVPVPKKTSYSFEMKIILM